MGFDLISSISGAVSGVVDSASKIIDKFIPDKTEAAKALAELASLKEGDDVKLALAQIQLNMIEAQGNWLQRCWRPLLGLSMGANVSAYCWAEVIGKSFSVGAVAVTVALPILLALIGARTVEKLQAKD